MSSYGYVGGAADSEEEGLFDFGFGAEAVSEESDAAPDDEEKASAPELLSAFPVATSLDEAEVPSASFLESTPDEKLDLPAAFETLPTLDEFGEKKQITEPLAPPPSPNPSPNPESQANKTFFASQQAALALQAQNRAALLAPETQGVVPPEQQLQQLEMMNLQLLQKIHLQQLKIMQTAAACMIPVPVEPLPNAQTITEIKGSAPIAEAIPDLTDAEKLLNLDVLLEDADKLISDFKSLIYRRSHNKSLKQEDIASLKTKKAQLSKARGKVKSCFETITDRASTEYAEKYESYLNINKHIKSFNCEIKKLQHKVDEKNKKKRKGNETPGPRTKKKQKTMTASHPAVETKATGNEMVAPPPLLAPSPNPASQIDKPFFASLQTALAMQAQQALAPHKHSILLPKQQQPSLQQLKLMHRQLLEDIHQSMQAPPTGMMSVPVQPLPNSQIIGAGINKAARRAETNKNLAKDNLLLTKCDDLHENALTLVTKFFESLTNSRSSIRSLKKKREKLARVCNNMEGYLIRVENKSSVDYAEKHQSYLNIRLQIASFQGIITNLEIAATRPDLSSGSDSGYRTPTCGA